MMGLELSDVDCGCHDFYKIEGNSVVVSKSFDLGVKCENICDGLCWLT